MKYEQEQIAELAEDLQMERGYPNADSLQNSGMLTAYTRYKGLCEDLTLEEIEEAIHAGFMAAEEARDEEE